jgi:hypothetical protein
MVHGPSQLPVSSRPGITAPQKNVWPVVTGKNVNVPLKCLQIIVGKLESEKEQITVHWFVWKQPKFLLKGYSLTADSQESSQRQAKAPE